MCVGIVPHDGDRPRAKASGPGNIIMLIGADTGRDGLHGATFASVDDPEASHRGVIQVGNPFLEKLLLEACLELLQDDDVVAMQDLGAAGLTSSIVECASRGGVGAEIDVALVPRREAGMSAYEVMLSESQERMLLVVSPEGADRVDEIVERWSLHASDDRHGHGRWHGSRPRRTVEVAVEVPAELFTDACPATSGQPASRPESIAQEKPIRACIAGHRLPTRSPTALLNLLGSPNIGSRRPVYEQYDHTIMTNTVVAPGAGDAAVIRLKGTRRGIALAIDCNSRYCCLDPYLGALHAVAEAAETSRAPARDPWRYQLPQLRQPRKTGRLLISSTGRCRAWRTPAAALGVPVVSGNVSLYNETAASRSCQPDRRSRRRARRCLPARDHGVERRRDPSSRSAG